MQAQQLPHNDYAEQVAIGCLLENYSPDSLFAELVAEDFYSAANRIIFSTARDLYTDQVPIGVFTVTDRLRRDGNLEKVGGEGYLERCANQAVSMTQAEGAIFGVRDSAMLRGGYLAISAASREFVNPSANAETLIGDLQGKLLGIASRGKEVHVQTAREAVTDAVTAIDNFTRKPGVTGVATGFSRLNYFTGGLQKDELVILAARPSMGKTSLMLDIAKNASLKGHRTYIFSLEMSKMQLAMRLLCSEAQVDSHLVRTGRATPEDHQLLAAAAERISHCDLLINDSSSDIMEIISTARREHQYHPLGLICIDYLGLIGTKYARGESRDREIGMITKQLKALAKELNVPVLLLSQLSRVNESQKVKRPTLNALRDSGNIEQDADTVIFIHSDDYYDREAADETLQEWRSDIIIEKQRNGPTAEIPMLFRRRFTRFYSVDTKKEAQPDVMSWTNN